MIFELTNLRKFQKVNDTNGEYYHECSLEDEYYFECTIEDDGFLLKNSETPDSTRLEKILMPKYYPSKDSWFNNRGISRDASMPFNQWSVIATIDSESPSHLAELLKKDTCCLLDDTDFSLHRIEDETKRRLHKLNAIIQ